MRSALLFISILCSLLSVFSQNTIAKDTFISTNDEPDHNYFMTGVKHPKELNLNDLMRKINFNLGCRDSFKETIVFRVLIDEEGCYKKHLPPKKGHAILVKEIEK